MWWKESKAERVTLKAVLALCVKLLALAFLGLSADEQLSAAVPAIRCKSSLHFVSLWAFRFYPDAF
jgi:hypothetical protein